jgi:hypothetical protein
VRNCLSAEAGEDAAESGDEDEGGSSDEEDYDREAARGQPTEEAGGDSGSSEEDRDDDDAETKGRKGEAGDEGALMRRVLQGVMEGSGGGKEAEAAGGVAVMDEEGEDGRRRGRPARAKAAAGSRVIRFSSPFQPLNCAWVAGFAFWRVVKQVLG